MRSGLLERMRRHLSFRLAAWYFIVFVFSSLAVSMVSYVFLSSSLRDNRKAIQEKVQQLASIAKTGGIEAVKQAAEIRKRPSRRTAFFVRMLDPQNSVVFINNPRLWQKFPVQSVVSPPAEGAWEYMTSKRDGDVLELITAKLGSGYRLQVGRTVEGRKEILEDYRNTITGVAVPTMLIALAGGTFFAARGLRPVRDLIQTTRSIVATGRTATRVPERGSGDELDELTKLFNQMLQRIESLIGGMREALDNVAHDLRTPMTRLRGIAEMTLQARPGGDHQQCQEALAGCVEESDRILKLLNSVMDISEAETGTLRLQFETIRVPELVQEVVDLYEYVAEERAVTVSIDCSRDAVIVGDRSRLRQVLANLLDNAIKYNARGGRVSINVREIPEGTALTVADNGMGIPVDEIPKIWDRLHRGDASRSQPGLGLGLSLVRAIVHAHGGHTEVQTEPGSGSAFMVTLPRNSARTI